MCIRRSEYYKPWPDKHYTFSWSLPFYNHSLRSALVKYRASLVDNEPDYNAYHPWGVKPNRNLHYKRLWGFFSVPKYNLDAPHFERNQHDNMNKIYDDLGYRDSAESRKARKRHEKMIAEGKHKELLREGFNAALCYKYPLMIEEDATEDEGALAA